MITSLKIEGYGCIQSAKLNLTPLHALIGPNDSGKSTILGAVAAAVGCVGPSGVSADYADRTSPGRSTQIIVSCDPTAHDGVSQFEVSKSAEDPSVRLQASRSTSGRQGQQRVVHGLDETRFLRLDPDVLRRPHTLYSEADAATYPGRDGKGLGLGSVYDAILGRGDKTFTEVSEEVRRLFPAVANIRIAVESNQKVIQVKLQDGTVVGAQQMSEGLLYYLAYAAIRRVSNAGVLLVEEPENGLHPARIADVVKVLRVISESGTQVLIATHSPLVINELKPEEVSVVTRDAISGTHITPIAETPDFHQRHAVYALGELWLSYANGHDEAPLLGDKR